MDKTMRRRSNSKSRSGTPTKRNSSPSTSHKKNSSPSPVKARSSARSKDTFSTPTKVSSKSLEKAATRAPVVEKDVPKYTWQQVAQHNVQSDMWVIINEKVYDITDWVDRHPGGIEMLRLVAGRDITVAFDNYHPFTKKHEAVLPKYYVGDLVEGSYEFPPYKKDTGFYADIKQEVGDYFKLHGVDPKDPWNGFWRMILVVAVCFTCYYYVFHPNAADLTVSLPRIVPILTNPNVVKFLDQFVTYDAETHSVLIPLVSSMGYKIALCILMGICQALPLLHVMHDCSHTAWGNSQPMWYMGGRFFLDFYAGCNMTSWHNQHTIGHHIYTNIFACDPDLPKDETGDVRRLVPRQFWSSICEYQHIYLPMLYGLLGISMRISDVSQVFTKHVNGPMRVNEHGYLGHLEHILSKACFFVWRFYIPYAVWNVDMSDLVMYSIVIELMTGYWLAYNFQVSHISTVADFPLNDKDGKTIEYEWAVAQTLSSVDYSHNSWWTTFCCGALNYQIEHHLLPSVSQYHYPTIAPIVKKICKKHGVRYNYFNDFYTAFYYHIKYLYILGHNGKVVPLQTSLH